MFRCCFCLYSFFLTVWKVHVIVLLLLWLWFLYMRGLVGNLLIWWRLHLNPVSFWYSLRSTVPPCMRHRQQWAILRALVVEIVSLENTLRTVSTGRQWFWIYVLYFYLPARGGSLDCVAVLWEVGLHAGVELLGTGCQWRLLALGHSSLWTTVSMNLHRAPLIDSMCDLWCLLHARQLALFKLCYLLCLLCFLPIHLLFLLLGRKPNHIGLYILNVHGWYDEIVRRCSIVEGVHDQ